MMERMIVEMEKKDAELSLSIEIKLASSEKQNRSKTDKKPKH